MAGHLWQRAHCTTPDEESDTHPRSHPNALSRVEQLGGTILVLPSPHAGFFPISAIQVRSCLPKSLVVQAKTGIYHYQWLWFSEWSEVRVKLALVILVARYTTPARRGAGTNEGGDRGEIEMGAATIAVWEIGGGGGRLELEGGGEGRSCPAV